MAPQTRNIAKNVLPRVLLPKSTKAKKDGITKAVLTKKNHQWHASTGGDESEEQSKDLEPKEINSHDECRTGLTIISMGPNFKKNSSKKTLLAIMLDKVKVQFVVSIDMYEVDMGRWCNICK
jgi:hypothetical protein